MKIVIAQSFLSILIVATIGTHAQTIPTIQWERSIGGTIHDFGYPIQQVDDGGYITAGYSSSLDGQVTGNHGSYDFWVVRLDADGNTLWQKSLGGSEGENAYSIQQIAGGGFIVAGSSYSNDFDVSGNHGDMDYWIVRLDVNGDLIWQKSLGGSEADRANSIHQTFDGGFIVAGYVWSGDGDVSGFHGVHDAWVVKLDSSGTLVWQKALGGTGEDEAKTIQQTTDAGYIIAGYSTSNDGDVTGNSGGGGDYWIVKLDENGDLEWQQTLGGSGDDRANSIQQTVDGGFIASGYSNSNDGDVSGNHGGYDYWVVRLNSTGNIIWQKSLGGSFDESASMAQQTFLGGFIVAGWSVSIDGDVTGNHGGPDDWIVKLDANGNLGWQLSLGGSDYENANSIQQTADSGFIIGGYSESSDGDITGNVGAYDYWIVKLSTDFETIIPEVTEEYFSINPNPVQSKLNVVFNSTGWDKDIFIYDLNGKLIDLPMTLANNKVEITTSSLVEGVYAIQVVDFKRNENQVIKFIKW